MNAVILGGTRGIGRCLARRMALRGDRLFLLGRDEDSLRRSSVDLQIRADRDCVAGCHRCDLSEPGTFAPALAAARTTLGTVDCVILTAARFATQEAIEQDPELARAIVTTDFAHAVAFCERARMLLVAGGGGTLVAFSSVAGDRPRSRVLVYGAAKAGLTAYLDGLDLRYRRHGLRVVCVKPGFVHTTMTSGLRVPPFAGYPDQVAACVLRGVASGRRVIYAPPIWRAVMLGVRALPRALLRRSSF